MSWLFLEETELLDIVFLTNLRAGKQNRTQARIWGSLQTGW
jgi:hypothetical protein